MGWHLAIEFLFYFWQIEFSNKSGNLQNFWLDIMLK
jgi:hypothetical protein